MKNLVTIRSFSSGFKLRLDPDAPFADVRRETAQRFEQGRSFFKDAAVAVTFEGRALTETEEELLVDAIINNSDLTVLCICKEDPMTGTVMAEAVHQIGIDDDPVRLDPDSDRFVTHAGSIKAGETVRCREHLLVAGNVEEGGVACSGGNVIVLGSLSGQVMAGDGDTHDEMHYVFAADCSAPEKLFVDGMRYRGQPKQKWGLRGRPQGNGARLFYVRDGVVAMVPAEEGLTELFALPADELPQEEIL